MTRRGAARLSPSSCDRRGTRCDARRDVHEHRPGRLVTRSDDRARRRFPVERLWNPFASFPRATKPGSTMSAQRRGARSCPKTCRAGSAGQGRWQVSRRRQTGSAAVKAHQDCETAMAYGLRAGDHCSGSVSPTAWMFSVQKRAVSGRPTLVGLLTVRSDGAGPCDAVPMQRRSLTSLRAVLLSARLDHAGEGRQDCCLASSLASRWRLLSVSVGR